jgi:hypothetical protein
MGKNRTGIQTSPIHGRTTAGLPTSEGGDAAIAAVRLDVARAAEPVGSMPRVPETVLLDKLGERLAFERSSVRLYQAVIDKLAAYSVVPGIAELREIQADELRHVDIAWRAIEKLGGDPTMMTPAASIAGVTALGIMQAAMDPRTQEADSLQALLVAELVDNEGWDLLVELARALGKNDLVEEFDRARTDEREHLAHIRAWLLRVVFREITFSDQPASEPEEPRRR